MNEQRIGTREEFDKAWLAAVMRQQNKEVRKLKRRANPPKLWPWWLPKGEYTEEEISAAVERNWS